MTPLQWSTSTDASDMLRHAAAHLTRPVLCRVLCDVVETALPYCDDDTVTAAVWAWDALRRWCRGEADLEEVEAASSVAAYAAYAAAYAAYAAAAYAAYAAAYAAAAYAAAYAAAADAADDAAYAYAYAAAADLRRAFKRRLESLAILVRQRLPVDPAATEYRLVRDTVVCQQSLLCQSPSVQVAWDAEQGA